MTPLQENPTDASEPAGPSSPFEASSAPLVAGPAPHAPVAPDAEEPDTTQPSGIARNQADGLRTLFGQREPVVFCVASALSPDATVALGLGTAHALRRRGHLTLLVDEVPLFERQSLTTPFPVRYDLGQVFGGDVALNRALRKVMDNLWFASGVRVRAAVDSKRARGPSLVRMLQGTEMDFDVVVVATCEPFGSTMRCYGHQIHRLMVVGTDDASLTRGLSHVRELSIMSGGEAVPVMVVGGQDADSAQQAFQRLEAASMDLLEQPLEWLGWFRAASTSAFGDSPLAGDFLPISMYQLLARHMAEQTTA
ncbi:MAG: hypothetical protein QUV35_07160 [Hydrogenophaga sp.]|uniref:MinD/ParA family ATP-binding protein n=1 Tax=Hydrogenophaga sp. TaxID=1904254 RepID=UPI002610F08F|nr:hypothetical protein [Hydrogenophaga sp.]MDM7942391.1 hypothetical protein [Hydrogenophaga sp.]